MFLPLSYSRHHELRNPPSRTRQRRIRQSQVGDTAGLLRILRIFPGIPLMPEQFCKILETSAPCGDVFLRSVVQVYYDRHKSAHGSGKPPYTPGRLHDGYRGRIYWLRLCQPYVKPCAAVANHRTYHHFHRAIRASHNAGFATNATFLHHMNKPFIG